MQLEGQQSVLAALQAHQRKFEVILIKSGVRQDRVLPILEEAEKQLVPVKFVSAIELDRLAMGKTHGGIIALCTRKRVLKLTRLRDVLRQAPGSALLLLLEGVEDSQHLGYVLRTAEALGAHAVILKKHVWDFDETRVSRASSGSFERLPVLGFSEISEISLLRKLGIRLYGCIANARRSMYDLDLAAPVALAVGGEKRGLSGALRKECDKLMKIPMFSEAATSLSLTHAACLLLGEAARQRFAASAR